MGKIIGFIGKRKEELTDWSTIQMASSKKAVIDISGYIGIPEDWQHNPDFAEKVIATKEKMKLEIDRISNLKVDEITVNIDSFGGSINHGLSIYNALILNPAKIIVNYVAWSASIATVIASAGDEINAPENFFGLIHEARGIVIGTKETMKNYSGWLEKVNSTIADIYSLKGKLPAENYKEIMSLENGEGVWKSASELKEIGLIDNILEPMRAAASFDETIEKAINFGININNLDMSLFTNKSKKVNSIKTEEINAVYEGDLKAGTKLLGIGEEIENGTYTVENQEIEIENSIVKSISEISPELISEDEVQNRINDAVATITKERDEAIAERDKLQVSYDDLEEKYNNLSGLSSKHKPVKKTGVENQLSTVENIDGQIKKDVKEITSEYKTKFEKKLKGED
jgi:ATP-dependent protease ClpP protease subunit